MTRAVLALLCALSAGRGAGATTLVEAWRVGDPGHGTPLMAGATVAYITRQYDLVAVVRWTGAIRWRARLLRPSTPANLRVIDAGGLIVAGVEALQAFDTNTGAEVWRVPDLGRYLGVAGDGAVLTGSADGRLFSFDPADGRVRWASVVVAGATVYAPRADAADGVAAFASSGAAGVVAFDAETGALRWRRTWPAHPPLGGGWAGGPLLVGRIVVMAEGDGQLRGLDRETGDTRWTVPAPARAPGLPPQRDYRALAATAHTLFTSSMDGSVAAYALSVSDAPRLVWTYQDSRNGSAGFGLAVGPRWLWCPFVGGLVAINPATGQEVWRAPSRLSGNALPPATLGGTVWAASAAGLTSLREKEIT